LLASLRTLGIDKRRPRALYLLFLGIMYTLLLFSLARSLAHTPDMFTAPSGNLSVLHSAASGSVEKLQQCDL
jgi:hypothetical protein